MKVLALPAFKNSYKNPYNYLLYSPMKQQGITVEDFSVNKAINNYYDIFHLHWPLEKVFENSNRVTSFLKMITLLKIIDWMRIKNTKIIWTVHNLKLHENHYPRLANLFWQAFIPRLDGYINLSETGKIAAQKHFSKLSNCSGYVVPMGHYRTIYQNDINKFEARQQLNLNQKIPVILFFGLIRPYKNVPHLIRVFRKLTDSQITLLIVGQPNNDELKNEILKAVENDKRVQLNLKFIRDQQIQVYLNASDLVVLPFKEILNSSSALLALSYNRPVLLPAKGSMSELKSEIGEAWIKTYTDDLTVEILQEGLSWACQHPRPQIAPLEKFNWELLSNQTLAIYRDICQK